MLKLGKVSSQREFTLPDIFAFNLKHMTWSIVPKRIEPCVDKTEFSRGGFRKAFKVTSITDGFNGTWVIKRYLPDALDTIQQLNQTVEEHTKKVVQMHILAKNFAEMLHKEATQESVDDFGLTLKFNRIYLCKFIDNGEVTTMEEFIEGSFRKYVNNTGLSCVSESDEIGQKCQCLAHFRYVKSDRTLIVLDLQGSGHTLFDPKIATTEQYDNGELLFCAGNLSFYAIDAFKKHHKCNRFCKAIDLPEEQVAIESDA